jgi:hypothetical protein
MSSNYELKDPVTGEWLEGRYETQAMRGLQELRELIAFFFYLVACVGIMIVVTAVLSEIVGMKQDKRIIRTLFLGVLIGLFYLYVTDV